MATRGQKRHLVTLEGPGPLVPDGDAGWTHSWVTLGSPMRAEIKPATARDLERISAGTVLSIATHIITMDYRSDVTLQTRVLFDGRTFSVVGKFNPDERKIDLVLTCVEIVQ